MVGFCREVKGLNDAPEIGGVQLAPKRQRVPFVDSSTRYRLETNSSESMLVCPRNEIRLIWTKNIQRPTSWGWPSRPRPLTNWWPLSNFYFRFPSSRIRKNMVKTRYDFIDNKLLNILQLGRNFISEVSKC